VPCVLENRADRSSRRKGSIHRKVHDGWGPRILAGNRLAEDGELERGADGNVVGVGDVVGFGDLRVLVGVAVEEQADGGEGIARLDRDGLGFAARGGNLVLEVGVVGSTFLMWSQTRLATTVEGTVPLRTSLSPSRLTSSTVAP
jgi:hypothetical protein